MATRPTGSSLETCGATSALARRVLGVSYNQLRPETVAQVKLLFLDAIGCMLAGAVVPWTAIIMRTLAGFGGNTEARVAHHGTRLAMPDAAAINATFAQGTEWDDYSTRKMGGAHIGAATWPVALAVGEHCGYDGRELLCAAIAGAECMARIGKTVRPSSDRRGHHPQGILAPFGAAATAGRLMNLSEEQMVMALSIASSFCGGLNEFTKTGGEVKRLFAGNGVRGGVVAAVLARAGFTGPPTILEGDEGFCRAYSDDPRLEELILPPVEFEYAILETDMKVFPAGGLSASSIEAMAALTQSHGFTHEAIASVRAEVSAKAAAYDVRQPTDVAHAQFSVPFSIALRAVVGANELRHYMDETLWSDPRILEIANHIDLVVAPDAVGDDRHSCRMTVTLKDGTKHSTFVHYPKGSFHNPMSHEEVEEKFAVMTGSIVGRRGVRDLIAAVDSVDQISNVGEVVDLMCAGRRD